MIGDNVWGVYKFKYRGVIIYRLGRGVYDARLNVAKKKGVPSKDIEILEDGKKQ